MKILRMAAALLLGSPAWGAYQWYISSDFHNAGLDPNTWAVTGDPVYDYSGWGLYSTGVATVTPVWAPAGGWIDYEVRVGVNPPGGTFNLYARMSPDQNSYYQVQFSSTCGGMAKVISGVYTSLGDLCGGGNPLTTARLIVKGNEIMFYTQAGALFIVHDSSLATGQPGFSVGSGYSGYYTAGAQIGPADTVPPASVNPGTIAVNTLGHQVGLRWPPVADDPNGIGLLEYDVYRNNAFYLTVPGTATTPSIIDESEPPGTNCAYTIYARDQHDNWSSPASVAVAVPQNGATPGYRTGVRPAGTYWGAAGEQIDLLSGNLNFSFPIIKAMARSGWSVAFALSYNSQVWSQNATGPWLLGYDAGYGFGWTLQAGSITPIWYGSVIDHYIFADSTGAQYLFDQNSNGVWTSLEGTYASYDANAARLYFTDGSFWYMGAQSAAGEPDAGTLYPTLMQDSNGNQLS